MSTGKKLCEMSDLDPSLIDSKPWAKNLLSNVQTITIKAILHWCSIIIEIGEDHLNIDEYIEVYIKQVTALYEDLIMDVDAIREKSLDNIMNLMEKLQALCHDLRLDLPTVNYEKVSLSQLRKTVVLKVVEYEALVQVRRNEVQQLNEKHLKISRDLGWEPQCLPDSPLPLPETVDEFKQKLDRLETEAMEREEKYFRIKEEIGEIVEELKAPPELDFEMEILNLTNTEVRISDGEIAQLETYRNKVAKQLDMVKEEIAELRCKINDLWDKIELDIAERDSFLKTFTGNSLDTLKALQLEAQRCEQIKKDNIQIFITKQREELVTLWEQCHCTEAQRNEFTFYHSECFNEDLFELHEREIEKWRAYYQANKQIFELLKEHQDLWQDLRQLDINANQINRYKNRGGQLLNEEKTRNRLHKKIPKIEAKIIQLAQSYFAHQKRPFLTFGLTVEEYISRLHEDRDKDIKEKMSAKKQQRDQQISSVGKSRMRLFSPSAVGPSLTPSVKRGVFVATTASNSKKRKVALEQKKTVATLPRVNVSKSRRNSVKREQRRKRLSMNKENELDLTSYSEFTRDFVSSRTKNSRSTANFLQEKIELKPPMDYLRVPDPHCLTPKFQTPEKKHPRRLHERNE